MADTTSIMGPKGQRPDASVSQTTEETQITQETQAIEGQTPQQETQTAGEQTPQITQAAQEAEEQDRLFRLYHNGRNEQQEQRFQKAVARSRASSALIEGIGQVGRALANLYYTTREAPSQKILTDTGRAKFYQQLDTERRTNALAYQKALDKVKADKAAAEQQKFDGQIELGNLAIRQADSDWKRDPENPTNKAALQKVKEREELLPSKKEEQTQRARKAAAEANYAEGKAAYQPEEQELDTAVKKSQVNKNNAQAEKARRDAAEREQISIDGGQYMLSYDANDIDFAGWASIGKRILNQTKWSGYDIDEMSLEDLKSLVGRYAADTEIGTETKRRTLGEVFGGKGTISQGSAYHKYVAGEGVRVSVKGNSVEARVVEEGTTGLVKIEWEENGERKRQWVNRQILHPVKSSQKSNTNSGDTSSQKSEVPPTDNDLFMQ